MECEEEEQGLGDDEDSDFEDPFIAEGLSLSSSSSETGRAHCGNGGQQCLAAGKAKQEKVRCALFCAK